MNLAGISILPVIIMCERTYDLKKTSLHDTLMTAHLHLLHR